MRSRFAAVAGALALALAWAGGGEVMTAAADGPSLVASPASALADGQFVKLTFVGLPPTIGVAFRECMATATIATALDTCTPNNQQVIGVTDAGGGGSTYLPVYTTGDDALKSASGKPMTCDSAHACLIAGVYHDLSNTLRVVMARITFAPSPTNCPPPQAGGILGSGSAAAYRAVYAWQSVTCLPPLNLGVGFTLGNSVDGAGNIAKGLTDFGVAGPLPPVSGTDPNEYAPITTSAVVLGYRIYDRRGPQVTSLVLTPSLIAKIYLGQIQDWAASAAIQALNPTVEFPSRTAVFARAEHSSQSYVFTSWLAANAPADWVDSKGAPLGARTVFPIPPSGVYGVTGSTNLGRAVVDPTTDFFDQGNMGFMDSSTAAFYGLPTVEIKEPSGAMVTPTTDAIERAISLAKVNANGTLGLDYATADSLAYPLAMPTYVLAPTKTISWDQGATLAAFLRYAVQASLGQSNLPIGYAPLPDNLRAISMKVADDLPVTPPPSSSPAGLAPGPLPPYQPPAFTPANPPANEPAAGATPTACPTPSPSPGSEAASSARTASPARNGSAAPAASPSRNGFESGRIGAAEPSASPERSPEGSALPSYCLPLATLSDNQGALLAYLVAASDTATGRMVLPAIVLLGLLALAAGGAVELVARRRRSGRVPAPSA